MERPRLIYMAYFGLIGLGFMLVEIPLIQRFILFLGHPTYALAAVLFTLLVFSALGSSAAGGGRLPLPLALGALVLLLLAAPWLLPAIFGVTLGLPLAGRLAVTLLVIAPLGFLMGMPFPGGIRWMLAGSPGAAGGPGAAGSPGEGGQPGAAGIPWIWAVNGAASVVSAVLAALLALSFGLDWVLAGGALCYAAAWLALRARVNPG